MLQKNETKKNLTITFSGFMESKHSLPSHRHHATVMKNIRSLLVAVYKSLLHFFMFQIKITTQIQRQQKIKVSSVNNMRAVFNYMSLNGFFYFTCSLFLTYNTVEPLLMASSLQRPQSSLLFFVCLPRFSKYLAWYLQ